MIRINVITEGQSELRFVKNTLNQYFAGNPVLDARCVLTSTNRQSNYEHRGGLTSYGKARRDIVNWLLSDKEAYVSTMFDFFRLPGDFPQYHNARQCQDHCRGAKILEDAMKKDILSKVPGISEDRFLPYIQLHEFEALLYTDIRVLKYDYLEDEEIRRIDRLYEETKNIPPEEINHGADTAPSKRIMQAVAYQKGDLPAEWLEFITIDRIREKCPHFSEWIERMKRIIRS